VGRPLAGDERAAVVRLVDDDALAVRLGTLLSTAEVDAFRARCRRLAATGEFPAPSGEWPAIPWPAF
jgi:hypothetical protein